MRIEPMNCDVFCTGDFIFRDDVVITGNFYAEGNVFVESLEAGEDIIIHAPKYIKSDSILSMEGEIRLDTAHIAASRIFACHGFSLQVYSTSSDFVMADIDMDYSQDEKCPYCAFGGDCENCKCTDPDSCGNNCTKCKFGDPCALEGDCPFPTGNSNPIDDILDLLDALEAIDSLDAIDSISIAFEPFDFSDPNPDGDDDWDEDDPDGFIFDV